MKKLEVYKNDVLNYHKEGNNCSQSAVLTFSDLLDIDKRTLFSVMEAFGAGMGSKAGACGAASGCLAALSLLSSSGSLENSTKLGTYQLSKDLLEEFTKKSGSLYCYQIKGEDREDLKPLISCNDALLVAVEITYNMIKEHKLA